MYKFVITTTVLLAAVSISPASACNPHLTTQSNCNYYYLETPNPLPPTYIPQPDPAPTMTFGTVNGVPYYSMTFGGITIQRFGR
jgi:hypothetical protein